MIKDEMCVHDFPSANRKTQKNFFKETVESVGAYKGVTQRQAGAWLTHALM